MQKNRQNGGFSADCVLSLRNYYLAVSLVKSIMLLEKEIKGHIRAL